MTCSGCESTVKNNLLKLSAVKNAEVSKESQSAILEMEMEVPVDELQKALPAPYRIADPESKTSGSSCCDTDHHSHSNLHITTENAGKYYCPMQCEGDKTYDKPGSCPVCGMNLEKIPELKSVYTCPMHPEISSDKPGACPICGMDLVKTADESEEEDTTYLDLLKKFKLSLLFTLPIFLISMSEMIPQNPLHKLMGIEKWNWVQFFLSLPVVFHTCRMFFERAYRSIVSRNLNMFTLIGIGAGVAWLFSVFALLFPNLIPKDFHTSHGSVALYFEATVVILTLVLLGQLLEAKAHRRTNGAIKELLKLAPSSAIIIKDAQEKTVSIDQIQIGDILRVKPGEKIPVDGTITENQATIDESMITGEPIPVDKTVEDKVIAGTINGTKTFLMKAEKIGSDTLLAQIVKMVSDASRSRAPIQKFADKISQYFVPTVVGISFITFILWYFFGPEPSMVYGFINAIAVLIIACPCALGLATPMSVMVGVGKGAQNGILIKNAEALEQLNKIEVLITDKTGTLTVGKPSVEKIHSFSLPKEQVIALAAAVNQYSEHPLAQAIVDFAKDQKIEIPVAIGFESITGQGVAASVGLKKVFIGNEKLMAAKGISVSEEISKEISEEQKQGKTVSFIAVKKEVVAYVAITDAIKETAKSAIDTLKKQGIELIMLTGDNVNTAKAVADKLGIAKFKASYMPEDKLNYVKELQAQGKIVAMAGDGINDAPALAQAQVGIAMGTGTDVAIESAKITLVKGDLTGIVHAKKLSDEVMKNIKQNLFFAFIYNALGVPIAAGILYPFFGTLLSPMIAATAMSFSSVSVIANALRLRNLKF